jgi:competence protein ComEA
MSHRKDVSDKDGIDLQKVISKRQNLWERVNGFKTEEVLFKYRIPIILLLFGAILVGLGVFYFKNDTLFNSAKIEVIEESTQSQDGNSEIVVEIVGAVQKSGVFKLPAGSRVNDLLITAGGLSADADRDWVEKVINRAGKLVDGQKIYIRSVDEQSDVSSANNSGDNQNVSSVRGSGIGNLININDATLKDLDPLPGIGPVYGQSIIDHRPYSSIEELLSKGALKQSVYDKIKDRITVF